MTEFGTFCSSCEVLKPAYCNYDSLVSKTKDQFRLRWILSIVAALSNTPFKWLQLCVKLMIHAHA